MKTPYISPKLNIVCFMPIEGIATEPINLDLELVNISTTFSVSRATSASETEEEEGDVLLPIG